jgi:crotonobetainyl-CoA:carnitine CoA-transferase CaiB-like acyl-CoA transferase
MGPLEGVTVLDLTRFLPGAVATMCLVRFGAEVIKIERPGQGDPARHLDGGAIFAYTNRGKKSVAIDLKKSKGKQLFCDLAQTADVIFENFRPGVMERLGLGYDALAKVNPLLIYASLTGYGRTGPMHDAAGHDINYVAMSGVLDLVSAAGARSPQLPGIQLADIAGGSQQVTIGVLLALYARHRTGRGQKVEVSMASAIGEILAMPLARYLSRTAASPRDGLLSGRFACYNLYVCKDCRWIAVGALEEKFWCNLCRKLNREDLQPQQFAPEPQQSEIRDLLASIFMECSSEEWLARLGNHDCCVTLVRTFEEACDAGQFSAYDVGMGANLSHTPGTVLDAKVPALGEHVAEIAQRLQLSADCFTQLMREGVIA